MPGKTLSRQAIIGERGAHFVGDIVLQLKHAWRALNVLDVGIDGEIEICDPVTGEATNTITRVQIKTTTMEFQGETADSFEFTCDQRDIDYWLRGNAPIILIVCRVETREAYWVSVKDYFGDLPSIKEHKVRFDKRRDRFDESCGPQLKQLALSQTSGLYFAPLPISETLYSNLLAVTKMPTQIYAAQTDFRRPGEIWDAFRSKGIEAGPEWLLSNRQILAVHDLSEPPYNMICDVGSCEVFEASEWADSSDVDREMEYVRLLNLCFSARNRILGLKFHKKHEYYYFPAAGGMRTRSIEFKGVRQKGKREVFKQYGKRHSPNQIAYCRHSAFKWRFLHLEAGWFVELTPTYHFTYDGFREDLYREEHLKGIKRLDRNPAVLGQLLMWAGFLARDTLDMFSPDYQFLGFGELATVGLEIGLPDAVWFAAEDALDARKLRSGENQLRLAGL